MQMKVISCVLDLLLTMQRGAPCGQDARRCGHEAAELCGNEVRDRRRSETRAGSLTATTAASLSCSGVHWPLPRTLADDSNSLLISK